MLVSTSTEPDRTFGFGGRLEVRLRQELGAERAEAAETDERLQARSFETLSGIMLFWQLRLYLQGCLVELARTEKIEYRHLKH